MQSYIEIIYIGGDGQGCQTNLSRTAATNAATWAEFNSYRRFAVDIEQAKFLFNYHKGNHDLSDTIPIDAAGFTAITGQTPKTDAEYQKIDAEFWTEITLARSVA